MSLPNRTWSGMAGGAAVFAAMSVLCAANDSAADQARRRAAGTDVHRTVRSINPVNHRMAGRVPVEINRLHPSASTLLGRRSTRLPHDIEIDPTHRDPVYFVTVYDCLLYRPGESGWRRLGTYETHVAADGALFLAYDRGHIPPGSQMRIVERRRPGTPPTATETKYFVVYRPPGESQRELGPYDTRRDAELALFRAVERGQIPPGSAAVIQEREVPIE